MLLLRLSNFSFHLKYIRLHKHNVYIRQLLELYALNTNFLFQKTVFTDAYTLATHT